MIYFYVHLQLELFYRMIFGDQRDGVQSQLYIYNICILNDITYVYWTILSTRARSVHKCQQ